MKLMSEVAKKSLSISSPKLVHFMAVVGGWRKLDEATMSDQLQCNACEGSDHYVSYAHDSGKEKVWICANIHCVTTELKNCHQATITPTMPKRAILWPLFCEYSGIGDVYHNLAFESVKQSPRVIQGLISFLKEQEPFLILGGLKGTGKTYAALGLCELFTRKNVSCVFTTQRKMFSDLNESEDVNFKKKLETCDLLVIDDLGTTKMTDAFLAFLMDLLDKRMSFKRRKTVITTNLSPEALSKECGDALSDRLRTGLKIDFAGASRR